MCKGLAYISINNSLLKFALTFSTFQLGLIAASDFFTNNVSESKHLFGVRQRIKRPLMRNDFVILLRISNVELHKNRINVL